VATAITGCNQPVGQHAITHYAGNSGTPPTLGITRPVRHRPSDNKLSGPHMPQGLSATAQTAYPARPGPAGGPHKGDWPRASAPASARPGNARPSAAFSASPVQRRPSPQQHREHLVVANQDRRAASATTNAPAAPSRTVPPLPKTGRIWAGAVSVPPAASTCLSKLATSVRDAAGRPRLNSVELGGQAGILG
jgi:hypothetical protein